MKVISQHVDPISHNYYRKKSQWSVSLLVMSVLVAEKNTIANSNCMTPELKALGGGES